MPPKNPPPNCVNALKPLIAKIAVKAGSALLAASATDINALLISNAALVRSLNPVEPAILLIKAVNCSCTF